VPRVLQSYLALVAGLTLGFAAAAPRAWLAVTALALAALSATLVGRRSVAGVCAVAAVGCTLATRAVETDARCRAVLLRGAPVLARLDYDAGPGAYVRARAVRPCTLDLSLGVDRGRGVAGAYVVVHGGAWPSGRGVRVPDATIVATGPVAMLPALRARAGRTIDRLFGRDAPLARALVVADARAIDASVRDRYADAGLIHALSVSGLHVAIVAGALTLLLRAVRLPASACGPLTVVAVAGYVALIGAPAPAVRAGVMLAAAALSTTLQRPTSPWAVFALGAGAPLVDPRAVTDLGYQLSVAGMAALVAGRHTAAALQALARSPDRVEAPLAPAPPHCGARHAAWVARDAGGRGGRRRVRRRGYGAARGVAFRAGQPGGCGGERGRGTRAHAPTTGTVPRPATGPD
jgi:competence protein ComEC